VTPNGSNPGVLPTPFILTHGGSFYLPQYPGLIYIDPNGAPTGTYTLCYQLNGAGAWIPYTGPFAVAPNTTVTAENVSNNTSLYSNSGTYTQTYILIPSVLPTPVVSPAGGVYNPSGWPSPTIDGNGAPGGGNSSISYMITHAGGSSTAWSTYYYPVPLTYGDTLIAKNVSLNATYYVDSPTTTQVYNVGGSTQLPPPLYTETTVTNSNGKNTTTTIAIYADTSQMQLPAGTRIYYTTDGTDPGVNSNEDPVKATLYDPTKPVVVPNNAGYFEVNARLYPPLTGKAAWDASNDSSDDVTNETLVASGNYDVDTSHLVYPLNKGTTDGHVHAYDQKYNTANLNMFNFADKQLRNIQTVIPAGVRFKLIMSNGNLSDAGSLVINGAAGVNPQSYENYPLSSLTVYSMDGVSGSTKLTSLAVNFSLASIKGGGLIPTETGAVRGNKVGKKGEYRDGALLLQAVAVNADGSAAFTTSTALSNGGVQGVAQTGLLWECSMFWHWNGGPY
jgi:hypothetical protein